MIGQDQTRQAVLDGIERLRDEAEWQRGRKLEEYENYYLGGDLVKQYLTKKPGEKAHKWAERQNAFCNANYVRVYVDKLVDGAFSEVADRKLEDSTKSQDEALQQVWDYNDIAILQGETGLSMVKFGDGWIWVTWDEQDEMVSLHTVHPGDIQYRLDRTTRRLIQVDERRLIDRKSNDDPVYEYLRTTHDSITLLGEDFSVISREDNPLGFINYVRYRGETAAGYDDGISLVRDQVTLQHTIIDTLSHLGQIIRYQSGDFAVFKGLNKPETEVGVSVGIELDPDGDFFFASPNAKITEVIAYIKTLVEMMFETGGVPVESIEGSYTESGVALLIKLRPFTQKCRKLQTRAIPADRRLVKAVCGVEKVWGNGRLPSYFDAKPVVTYPEQILPVDVEAEFQRDLAKVTSGLMALTDFHIKHTDGVDTKEDAIKYIERIQEEDAKYGKAKPEEPERPPNPFEGMTF